MAKRLHFSYKSPENFVNLLVTIQIANNYDKRIVCVYHKVFDSINGDEQFYKFMVELFPNGCTIGKKEIELITDRTIKYLNFDEKCRHLFVEYDKQHCGSYVYSKALDKLYPAEFGEHLAKVVEACQDFFLGADNITTEAVRKFIRNNLEIKSDNTSINTILNDVDYITRCCVF